jgi:hypothetical protein
MDVLIKKLSLTLLKMKKFKKFLTFLAYNAAFATCLYFGAYKGIAGFMNMITFLIWFLFIVYAITCGDEKVQIVAYNSSKSKYAPVSNVLGIGYIGVLVFYGHILLGALYVIIWCIFDYMIKRGKELVESASS